MSTALREGITRLEVTSRVTLGVLALASGVYTYLGVRELLNGNATVVFFAAVIYSVAVSVGIYAFWSFLMRLLPHVVDHVGRALLFGAMLLGSLMIIAMSAWLNATALAGAAALEQHLAVTLQSYTPRSRSGEPLCTLGAEPAARHPDGVAALRSARRVRKDRHPHRHDGFRYGGAAAGADVEPAQQPFADRHAIERAHQGALCRRWQASRQDAGPGFEPRSDRAAQRCLRHRIRPR